MSCCRELWLSTAPPARRRPYARGNPNPRSASCATSSRAASTPSWQTVERKVRFIAQIIRGRLDVREIDDIGEATTPSPSPTSKPSPPSAAPSTADVDLDTLERVTDAPPPWLAAARYSKH